MKIYLAGYNIDTEVIDEFKASSPERQDITPETLSASYARISRDPRPINELRKAAREEVEKSRKSNSSIIFKMGHHSVAEHAVFNFDLIGISRLAVESIEHFRLCSFTEKSQRYITLDSDFVVPKEIVGGKYESKFLGTIKMQNSLYNKLNEKLSKYVFDKYSDLAKDTKNTSLLEGWAKEDARYITPLATSAQLGLTVNARSLELIFRRFASQNLSEVKEVSEKMFSLVHEIAPSIILFTEANNFDSKTYGEIKSQIPACHAKQFGKAGRPNLKSKRECCGQNLNDVKLINYTQNADEMLVASLLFSGSVNTMSDCLESARNMSQKDKEELVKASCKHMLFYDSVIREYENIDLTFEVSLSSACFGQLKRHRMATIITQPYDPSLGITIPPAISDIGMDKEFSEVAQISQGLYEEIYKDMPEIAPYILTNAHKRRVIFKCNARELYHVSRLREDAHAQWDIRNVTRMMSEEAKKVMPLTMMFIGGKDRYKEIYDQSFSDQ